MSGDGNALVENGSATVATLDELAGKMVELRQQLERVVVSLDQLRDERRNSRLSSGELTARRSSSPSGNRSSLECQACGRRRTRADEEGWTLRLCGDDELHPFCPDCDRGMWMAAGR